MSKRRLGDWLTVMIIILVAQACSSAPADLAVTLVQVPPGFEDARRLSMSSAPRLVDRREPHFPGNLAGVNTAVTAEIYVGETGRVAGVRFIDGDRRLIDPLAQAASHWRFEPLTVEGAAIRWVLPVTVTVTWQGSPVSLHVSIL
jgi:hypothetical protein